MLTRTPPVPVEVALMPISPARMVPPLTLTLARPLTAAMSTALPAADVAVTLLETLTGTAPLPIVLAKMPEVPEIGPERSTRIAPMVAGLKLCATIALLAALVTAPVPVTVTPPVVPARATIPKPDGPAAETLPLPVTSTSPLPLVNAWTPLPFTTWMLPFCVTLTFPVEPASVPAAVMPPVAALMAPLAVTATAPRKVCARMPMPPDLIAPLAVTARSTPAPLPNALMPMPVDESIAPLAVTATLPLPPTTPAMRPMPTENMSRDVTLILETPATPAFTVATMPKLLGRLASVPTWPPVMLTLTLPPAGAFMAALIPDDVPRMVPPVTLTMLEPATALACRPFPAVPVRLAEVSTLEAPAEKMEIALVPETAPLPL